MAKKYTKDEAVAYLEKHAPSLIYKAHTAGPQEREATVEQLHRLLKRAGILGWVIKGFEHRENGLNTIMEAGELPDLPDLPEPELVARVKHSTPRYFVVLEYPGRKGTETSVHQLPADVENHDAAIEHVLQKVFPDYNYSTYMSLNAVTLHVVTATYTIDPQLWREKWEARRDKQKAAKARKERRKQYEELKKEFGDG